MVLHNDKWARKAKKAVERRKGVKLTSNVASTTPTEKPVTEEGDIANEDIESEGDARFARREVLDNSARYDESFDPYLETDIDHDDNEGKYHTLTTRPFETKEPEKVIDDRPTGVIKMDDTTGFDAMRLMKQKEEYARDLKMRFGVRKGFEKNAINTTTDDDAFFNEIDNVKAPDSRPTKDVSKTQHSRPEDERFLDELLKL